MSELLVIALTGGSIAGLIASSKGHGFGIYFVVGCLLPLIGIVIALLAPREVSTTLGQLRPAASVGWHQDPTGRFDQRYYDGKHWTKDVFRDQDRRQLEDPI